MRDIHKLCRICLNPGTRDIFDNGFSNIISRDELNKIVEKLRFVTLLKVSPKENLPQQICDLCIVQLNVSYNFKRLALKNDFYIRQYMIENGMNLLKEDDDHNVETSLEIHQIHNVIRTNRYRPSAPAIQSIINEPFRRNSTTSSVSGISTMIVNNCENNIPVTNGNSSDTQFVHPSRPFVQPIQIKTEPVDPDDEIVENNGTNQTNQSSPSSSSSGSVLTVNSSEKSIQTRPKTPPMIVINGHIESTPNTQKSAANSSKTNTKENEKSKEIEKRKNKENEEPKKLNVTNTRSNKKTIEKPREKLRNLRSIKRPSNPSENKRKLREAAKKMIDKRNQQKKEAKIKKIRKEIKIKISKNGKVPSKKQERSNKSVKAQKGKGKGRK